MKKLAFHLTALSPEGWRVWTPDGLFVDIEPKMSRKDALSVRAAIVAAWYGGRADKARELREALKE